LLLHPAIEVPDVKGFYTIRDHIRDLCFKAGDTECFDAPQHDHGIDELRDADAEVEGDVAHCGGLRVNTVLLGSRGLTARIVPLSKLVFRS
tara:strand:+ start:14033 stop:14305 length:273 start_codon:yes stop_codon:yes gene_type:complete